MAPTPTRPLFISCGMYAFTTPLRESWQVLFDGFVREFDSAHEIQPALQFESDQALLRDDYLFIGHTCGYPLMRYLKDSLVPVCVAVFSVEGCDGKSYSSALITTADGDISTLGDCAERIAVINGADSNSGMNVLRHAIAGLNPAFPFFARVDVSGSHLQSLTRVAEGKADIAAIDSVSFAYIRDAWPDLVARVRIIGFSASSCGLPFVMNKSCLTQTDTRLLISALNRAVEQLSEKQRDTLHISHFEATALDDYGAILEMEKQAIEAGYGSLG